MKENKTDEKMASRAQEIICNVLVLIWCLLSFVMMYLVKLGEVTDEMSNNIIASGLLVVMINDFILGLYFNEYPSPYGSIKKEKYPKSYWVRTIFDAVFVFALCLFLVKHI